jgi:hypothetical protein
MPHYSIFKYASSGSALQTRANRVFSAWPPTLFSNMLAAAARCKRAPTRVFEQSFDWKECSSDRFIDQKLDYMHDNPCRGVWRLAASPVDYLHSSAKFYLTGDQGIYPVINSGELKDIDLTIKAIVRKSVEQRYTRSPRRGRLRCEGRYLPRYQQWRIERH